MVTALQIILVLVLISLIGIIIGYLFGKLYCKKSDSSKIIEKGTICEEEYNENLLKNSEEDTNTQKEPLANDSIEVDTQESEATPTVQSLVSQTENKEDSSSKEDEPLTANEESEKKDEQETKEATTDTQTVTSEDEIKEENIESSATKDNSEETKDLTESQKPQSFLSEPKYGQADNLCRIKGIGVVIEEKLHNLGIFHFEQIANFTEDEIKWIDEHLAFKGRITREDWVGQAKLLAEGKETEFSKRVDKGEVESSKKS